MSMSLDKEEKQKAKQRIKAYQKEQKKKRKMLNLKIDDSYLKVLIKLMLCFLIAAFISLIVWLMR